MSSQKLVTFCKVTQLKTEEPATKPQTGTFDPHTRLTLTIFAETKDFKNMQQTMLTVVTTEMMCFILVFFYILYFLPL